MPGTATNSITYSVRVACWTRASVCSSIGGRHASRHPPSPYRTRMLLGAAHEERNTSSLETERLRRKEGKTRGEKSNGTEKLQHLLFEAEEEFAQPSALVLVSSGPLKKQTWRTSHVGRHRGWVGWEGLLTCQSRGYGHGHRAMMVHSWLLEAQEHGSLCGIGQGSRAYALEDVGCQDRRLEVSGTSYKASPREFLSTQKLNLCQRLDIFRGFA